MKVYVAVGLFLVTLNGMALLGYQPADKQPTPAQPAGAQPTQPDDEEHPAGGHPKIPRPEEDWPKAKAEDVSSIDAIVKAYYTVTSGARGQARDWDRYRSLFLPQSRLIAVRPAMDGSSGAMIMTPSEYVEANRKYFEKGGFFDKEIARRTETFGNMAHVWSTYESRRKAEDPEPYVRGINSMQLLRDGERWWIVSAYWDYERPESPIPDAYLKSE